MARALLGTIFACAVLLLLTVPVHGGFIVLFAAPFLLIWLPYSGYIIWAKPARRRLQIIKVGLSLIAIGITCSAHWYYSVSARTTANNVIRRVVEYKEQHGSYPERLEDAGVVLGKTGGPWHIGYVADERKTHSLIYPTTFTVFEAYIYEFEADRWVYLPD